MNVRKRNREKAKLRKANAGLIVPAFTLFALKKRGEYLSASHIVTSTDRNSPFGLPDCAPTLSGEEQVDFVLEHLTQASPDFSKELLPYVPQLLLRVRDLASRNGAKLFNGRVVRLEDWSYQAEGATPSLVFKFRPTNWFSFAVTNFSLEQRVGNQSVKTLLPEEPKRMQGAKRANNMAVSINILIEEGKKRYVVLTQRSKQNANYPGVWGHTAGGDIDPELDINQEGEIDPLKAVVRELKEELGYELSVDKVQVLALILKSDQLQPILITQAIVKESPAAFRKKVFSASEAWEVNGNLQMLPFTPSHVARFLAVTPKKTLAPTLITDLYFSLLHCYGKTRVSQAFKRWGGIKTQDLL